MRLIDADALIKSIKGYRLGKIPKGELEWKIENAPTVDAAEVVRCNWIPVSERLPEVLTPVLVMHRYEPYDRVTIGCRFQPDKRHKPYWIFFAHWMGDDMMHHAIGDHMICPGGEYVTHWMPLPEPPKEESHET